MADVNRGNRPLSPHISIYRKQLTSASSIMVRITGIASLFIALLVVWWLLAASTSQSYFTFIDGLLRSWLGDLVLLGGTWAIFYHTLGRLRHLIWDLGYHVNVQAGEKMAVVMFALATVLTILTAIAL